MGNFLNTELEHWPIDASDRRKILECRISMLGRTNWKGYPPDYLKWGRTWTVAMVIIGMPIAIVATLVGLLMAGSPAGAAIFSATLLIEWAILVFLLRRRRRAANRAAALELGFPVCLLCGYFNGGHQAGDPCNECGAEMIELPKETFPPPEEGPLVKSIRDHRRRHTDKPGQSPHKPH
ncbi:MAG: hypothetical protein MK085_03875 [Phycisphaerales bacterium]|nr:hypothetical protein [Phycisphaerales bacterium]